MNELQIDPASLQSEAAALATEFPGAAPAVDPAAPVAPVVSATDVAAYQMLATGAVAQGASILVPAWKLTQPECKKLGDAIVNALLLWFPDGMIPPKYMAVLAIVGVGWEIVEARRDPETGSLRPAKYVKQSAAAPADQAA